MTGWHALTDDEIVELTTGLRSLDWSWQLQDVPAIAARFDWQILMTRKDWVMLDCGFGLSSGSVDGRDGVAESIKLMVTDSASEDATGRAMVRDALVRMTDTITGALGEPTARMPGESAEIRWAFPETTLRLKNLSLAHTVQLTYQTNASLAALDRSIEFEQQGLT
ncbi:DUF6301 family protein [Nocardia sp. NBC_00565]|uniref:DUF6301 family protein n=1 Tax=Nocardia sp. NBC_00565 TaxID=2975993 RepID=UPI002E7FDA02|nr:DUF6301 family protein [Nocardia sp. NBC_00565]WUC02212.1 DUF6301 family protein [Nocardia sp. NBC_00565]